MGYWLNLFSPTMVSHRDSLRAYKRPRATSQKDTGTLYSVFCSATIWSDPPQEGSHKASRKIDEHESAKAKNHHRFEGVKAFQNFKRATRIESLSEDLSQLRRHVQIPSGALSAADLPSPRISRLLYYQREISDTERLNILRIVYQPSDFRNVPEFRSPVLPQGLIKIPQLTSVSLGTAISVIGQNIKFGQ